MTPTIRSVTLSELDSSWPEHTLTAPRMVQDSRAVSEDCIFVAMGSTGASGHEYIPAALNQGARWIMVDDSVLDQAQELAGNNALKVIGIPNLAKNVGLIASMFWGNPSQQLSVVGVTGTNGKTSTVQLLCQAWGALGIKSASIGTLGAGIHGQPLHSTGLTTPSVCQVHEILAGFLEAGVTHVGMELSSHALEQNRVQAVNFTGVAFTNISRDHLDFHETMDNYIAAKEKIFDLPGTPHIVVNVDDFIGQNWAEKYAATREITTVSSAGNDANLQASDETLSAEGMTFTLSDSYSTSRVSSSLLGRFNIDNLLIVAGELLCEGIDIESVATILPQLQPVFGRMNRIKPYSDSPLVVIDYAHTPDALDQGLRALKPYGFASTITVFGCTGDRDTGKRPEMARIAEQLSDVVVVTDDDVHWEDGDAIVAEIRTGFTHPEKVVELRDRATALKHAISLATSEDVVFIAGKGHEQYLLIEDTQVPFSDTECASQFLEAKHAGNL